MFLRCASPVFVAMEELRSASSSRGVSGRVRAHADVKWARMELSWAASRPGWGAAQSSVRLRMRVGPGNGVKSYGVHVSLPRPNQRPGPLAGHVRKGRTYRSPLAATGVLQIGDWVRDDLPDL